MGVFDKIRSLSLAPAPERPEAPEPDEIHVPSLREVGAPATINSGGYLLLAEEANAKWRVPRERFELIELMRRTDGQIKASVLCWRLPILASQWLVRAPEDPTPEEEEIAKFVEENLHGMTTPWVEMLGQILNYLEFGFGVFEKIYKVGPDRRWHWKKWATRPQSSIINWNVAPDGGLKSVTQWVWKNEKQQKIDLAIDRLLVFTNDKEGANWEGQSILRAAYPHFYLKDKLYRIDAIAHERHGVGIPVVKMADGSDDGDYDVAEEVLINLRSHEKGYVIEPPGYEVRILEIPTQARNMMESIKHHDEKIATSMLTQFLNLGFSSTGSRSLGQTFSDFFLASLNSKTAYIAGIINRHAVKQLVDVNFGEQAQGRYPQLKCVPVAGINFELFAKSMLMLGQNDLLAPDQKLLEHIATMFGLPRPEPNALEKQMEREVEHEAKLASMKAASMPKPGNGGSGGAASKKSSGAGSGVKRAAREMPPQIESAIELQVASLVDAAKECDQNNMKIRPRMEGTLSSVVWMNSDKTNRKAIDFAVNEFSRRMAAAAEIGWALGNVEQLVLEEAEASKWLLLASLGEGAPIETS